MNYVVGDLAINTMAGGEMHSEKHWDNHYADFSKIITLANREIESCSSLRKIESTLSDLSLHRPPLFRGL
jgi:hypothetical protein